MKSDIRVLILGFIKSGITILILSYRPIVIYFLSGFGCISTGRHLLVICICQLLCYAGGLFQTQTAMPEVVSLCGLNSFLRHLQSDVGMVRMLGVTLMSIYCDVFMFILGYSWGSVVAFLVQIQYTTDASMIRSGGGGGKKERFFKNYDWCWMGQIKLDRSMCSQATSTVFSTQKQSLFLPLGLLILHASLHSVVYGPMAEELARANKFPPRESASSNQWSAYRLAAPQSNT